MMFGMLRDPPPASVTQMKVELIQASPCPADLAIEDGGRVGCWTAQTAMADLDHDGRPDCIQRTRCVLMSPLPLRDGTHTNQPASNAERFEEFAVLRFGKADEPILARVEGYGSGNIHVWTVIDVVAGSRDAGPSRPYKRRSQRCSTLTSTSANSSVEASRSKIECWKLVASCTAWAISSAVLREGCEGAPSSDA